MRTYPVRLSLPIFAYWNRVLLSSCLLSLLGYSALALGNNCPEPTTIAPFITTWKTDNLSSSHSTFINIPTYPRENYNNEVAVPNLKGKTREEALTLLNSLGIEAKFIGEGIVSEQSIAHGNKVNKGKATIVLTLIEMGD